MLNGHLESRAIQAGQSVFTFARKERMIITLGFLAFFWAIAISLLLFPYYSNDHDELVYILQAQMLLQGKLYLAADEFSRFFTPFFFINDGEKVFSKYTPVHAGFLALGNLLFGSMRVSIGLVAALNVVIFYLFTLELYPDRRFALKAAAVLLLSPLFLVQSATFLPYTTGLMLLLAFGFLLLRGVRTGSLPFLVPSGLALGLAFFHRPYDALLFATPFCLILLKLYWNNLGQLLQRGAWISMGFAPFLALTLGYNALMTGNPLLFPFTFHEALDKLGFGLRRAHPTNTPLAFGWAEGIQGLWGNSVGLFYWTFGGPILILAMLVRLVTPHFQWQEGLLLLILVTFPLGYLFFWGPYHVAEIWNGLDYLGPFYYIPLLIPIILLGMRGVSYVFSKKQTAAVVLVSAMFAVDLLLVFDHISKNYRYTQENRAIYEPFLNQEISNALVFVPPLYGPFLLHPFGYLSNSPSLDGPLLFALDHGSENLDLMERYPDRQPYRFDYRGYYTEEPDDVFDTELVKLQGITTPELTQSIRIVNPTSKPYVYTYVWNDGNTETYLLDDSSSTGSVYDVRWRVTPTEVTLEGPRIGKSRSELDSISEAQPLAFAVAFTDSPSRDSQVIFERRFSVRITPDNMIEAILPPEEWHNPDWPTGEWVRANITHVLRDSNTASQDPAATGGGGQNVRVVISIDGLEVSPVSMAEAPDGRLFYNELKTGNVRIMANGVLQEAPFATVEVATFGESGLLGLALDPDFPDNHYVYVLRTVPDGATGRPVSQEVIRFTDDQGKGVDPLVIVGGLPATKNSVHNGGRLEFGPDGKLWITIGDGGPFPETLIASQDPSSYYGKVLRFNKDGSIPTDNPVPNSPVYAMGFRNPFGMAFHPVTGNLFVSENGPEDSDEINAVFPSGNYGWPKVRGTANRPERYVDPVYVWHQPIAPSGLAFHPEDPNILFVCSAIGGELRALTLGASFESVVGEEVIAKGCHLDAEVSRDGNLYISGFDSIRRVQLRTGP